jgi:hypothetical protein
MAEVVDVDALDTKDSASVAPIVDEQAVPTLEEQQASCFKDALATRTPNNGMLIYYKFVYRGSINDTKNTYY